MAESKKVSVFELCVTRAVDRYGMIKGGRIGGRQAAFVVEWGKYLTATGDDPGNAWAFARWANVSHGTAYNRLEEFRSLFPEDETPAKLAGYLGSSRRARASSRRTPHPAST